MKCAAAVIGAMVLALTAITPAQAEKYEISPGSALAIGEGFDPRQPRQMYLPCVQYDGLWATGSLDPNQKPDPNKPYTTSAGFSFDSTTIESRKRLYEFVHLSASISGGYGFFSGAASYLSEDEFRFDENSYHFAMRASTEFGDFRLMNPRLNADAQVALYRSPSAFFERCGTEFVGQQTRGASIAVIYSVHSLDQYKRSRIEKSLQASFGNVVGGDLNYRQTLEEAIKTGTLKVRVFGYGGEGVSKLKDLVTNNTDVAQVKKTISDYVQSLGVNSSVPTAYVTGSMTSLDPRLGSMQFGLYNRRIAEYILVYEDLLGYRSTLQKVLRGQALQRMKKDERAALENAFDRAGILLSNIEKKALECRDDLSVKIANVSIESHPKATIDVAPKCDPLTSDEMLFALPKLPNPLPFEVTYGTGTAGISPKDYLWLKLEGTGIQEAQLVGGFNGFTRQYTSIIDAIPVTLSSTGENRASANFDLAEVRTKAPIAVAVRMMDGFSEFFELTLPGPLKEAVVASAPEGKAASETEAEAVEVKPVKLKMIRIDGFKIKF